MTSPFIYKVILDFVLFLGLSDDDVVDADEAVRQLELIASNLRQISLTEKQEFLAFVQSVADAEEDAGVKSGRIEFMRQIGENLGLN